MLFSKRENYCWEWDDGDVECHRDGWWDSEVSEKHFIESILV
jgi:hypothetical protein